MVGNNVIKFSTGFSLDVERRLSVLCSKITRNIGQSKNHFPNFCGSVSTMIRLFLLSSDARGSKYHALEFVPCEH